MTPAPGSTATDDLPATWLGLFHDTSVWDREGDVGGRLDALGQGGAVGSVCVSEDQLPDVPEGAARIRVAARGGAGVVPGVARLAARRDVDLVGLDVALRDEDDLASNARRVLAAVDAARAEGDLAEETPVHLVLPAGPASYGWLAAADVAAEAELGVGLRTGGAQDVGEVASWIDAALDRGVPFVGVDGPAHAVTGPAGAGFANLLLATAALWDGAGAEAATQLLATTDATAVAGLLTERGDDLVRARRWLVSLACPDPSALAPALAGVGVPGHSLG
ncbi:MAG: hypothetical protein ACI379_11485 [Nocardioides sp.]|uniref:hypothetical protein n=1 Tax=Nocardioides sp. TaxID=35761 RepID=UPI003EFDFDAB